MSKNSVIVVLVLALAACIVIIFSLTQQATAPATAQAGTTISFTPLEPVNDSTAKAWIGNFRQNPAINTAWGVYYDSAALAIYLTSAYTSIIHSVNGDTIRNTRWVLGFYYTQTPDAQAGGKPRPGLVIVPTLVDTTNGQSLVIDYYNNKTGAYDWQKGALPAQPLTTACDTCKAYDAGHLWP
jgi:hypothetical protein